MTFCKHSAAVTPVKVMSGIKGIKFLLFFLFQLDNSVLATVKTCLPLSPTKVNVHLIPHSHDDVGWKQTMDEYYRNRVRSIYDTVIEALWADEKRRYFHLKTLM